MYGERNQYLKWSQKHFVIQQEFSLIKTLAFDILIGKFLRSFNWFQIFEKSYIMFRKNF